MAQLTRKFLRALGVEDDKIDEIVNTHQDTLEEIRAERDGLKESASKLAQAQAEVIRLTEALEKAEKNGGDAAKVQAEFDAYRQQVETEKANAAKSEAVRKALKASGVQREEFLDLLMGKVELDKVEMDGDAVKDEASFVAPFKASYAGCFASESEQGTKLQNPPSGGGTRMTKEQIAKIENRDERRAAIAANLDLYN